MSNEKQGKMPYESETNNITMKMLKLLFVVAVVHIYVDEKQCAFGKRFVMPILSPAMSARIEIFSIFFHQKKNYVGAGNPMVEDDF